MGQLDGYRFIVKLVKDTLEEYPPGGGKLLRLPDHPMVAKLIPRDVIPDIMAIDDPIKHDSIVRGTFEVLLGNWQSALSEREELFGNGDELLEVPDHDENGNNQEPVEDLPADIHNAACNGIVDPVLEWLGIDKIHQENPFHVVPPARINAKCSTFSGRTLLAEAAFSNAQGLIHILLQAGAYVDPVSDFGTTPLQQSCSKAGELEGVARILLQWGADTTRINEEGESLMDLARSTGSRKLAALLEAPLGGRRCEIVNLPKWNGRTVVATKYVPAPVDKYVVQVELTGEKFKARPEHLKRRDKTPKDPAGIFHVYQGIGSHGGNIFVSSPCAASESDREYFEQFQERQKQKQEEGS